MLNTWNSWQQQQARRDIGCTSPRGHAESPQPEGPFWLGQGALLGEQRQVLCCLQLGAGR